MSNGTVHTYFKYIVLFPIPEPQRNVIHDLMFKISKCIGLEPPCKTIMPHITLHRPIRGGEETGEKIIKIMRSSISGLKQTHTTISDISTFGKEYIVLRANVPLGLASLWVELNEALHKLPGYKQEEFDMENTLHITLASKTSKVFQKFYSSKNELYLPKKLIIPIENIALYRRPTAEENSKWERVKVFSLAK